MCTVQIGQFEVIRPAGRWRQLQNYLDLEQMHLRTAHVVFYGHRQMIHPHICMHAASFSHQVANIKYPQNTRICAIWSHTHPSLFEAFDMHLLWLLITA